MAVHDRLRHASGAARVDDPQRLVERQPLRLEAIDRLGVRRHRLAQLCVVRDVDFAEAAAVEHEGREVGKRRAQRLDDFRAIDPTPGVENAVRRDQDFWVDLLEAVDDRLCAHVRGAYAPDRPDARAGEKGDNRLRNVGHASDNAIASAHAEAPQRRGERCDAPAQFGPREFGDVSRLVFADDRRHPRAVGRLHVTEDLPRVVHLRARKPLARPAFSRPQAQRRAASATACGRSPKGFARTLPGR